MSNIEENLFDDMGFGFEAPVYNKHEDPFDMEAMVGII